MRNILITGADGFVGRHLQTTLHAALQTALQTAFPAARITAASQQMLDITHPENVAAMLSRLQPDACVHLAAMAAIGAARQAPDQAWAVNFHGALNMGRAILATAPQCRLLFISSAEIYGNSFHAGTALDETALPAPMNLYAATKAAAELALGALSHEGLRLLRLRPFNHTGPGQSEAFVVPAFAMQIARIEAGLMPPQMAVGTLSAARDFLDVRDVCAAYVLALQKFDDLPNNTVLNIASGTPVRIGDMLELLLAQAQTPVHITTDPARLRAVEIATAVGNANAARNLLGWQPRHSLAETLQTVLAYARATVAGRVDDESNIRSGQIED